MQSLASSLRLSAGAAALLVAFNAGSADPVSLAAHPLLDNGIYGFRLANALDKATGDVTAQNRTRGFTQTLEEKLRVPASKPQFVGYPNPAANGQLVISAVVPPASRFATASIPVCAEQGDKIVGTYSITPKGDVVPDPWAGAQPVGASSGFAFLCRDYIKARGQAMMQTDPAQPPPVKAEETRRP